MPDKISLYSSTTNKREEIDQYELCCLDRVTRNTFVPIFKNLVSDPIINPKNVNLVNFGPCREDPCLLVVLWAGVT